MPDFPNVTPASSAPRGLAPGGGVLVSIPTVRLLVTGSRFYPDAEGLEEELELAWHEATEANGLVEFVLVHGDCPTGADAITQAWAERNRPYGVRAERHPAEWDVCGFECPPTPQHRRPRRPGDIYHPGTADTWCPGAGPRRNAAMAALGANLCLAALHGPAIGTRDCIRHARSAGIPVRVLAPRESART